MIITIREIKEIKIIAPTKFNIKINKLNFNKVRTIIIMVKININKNNFMFQIKMIQKSKKMISNY